MHFHAMWPKTQTFAKKKKKKGIWPCICSMGFLITNAQAARTKNTLKNNN